MKCTCEAPAPKPTCERVAITLGLNKKGNEKAPFDFPIKGLLTEQELEFTNRVKL